MTRRNEWLGIYEKGRESGRTDGVEFEANQKIKGSALSRKSQTRGGTATVRKVGKKEIVGYHVYKRPQ